MILVIGASGNVGSKLVEQLATAGHQVRALVRNPEKATRIQGLGVDIVPGDLARTDTLDAALKGVEKVFLLSSDDPRQVELQGNLIERACRGAVRRVVKLSAFTAALDSPVSFARWHWQTEQQLLASGLASTILRPTLYMQNLVTYFAQSIATEGIFVLPMKEGKVSQVDARDLAAVAARVLTEEGHDGKIYTITGPEALSFTQVAEKLSAALGRRMTYVDPPVEVYRQALLEVGTPAWFADALIALYGLYSQNTAAHVTTMVADLTQRPARTFDQFARDYAPVFSLS